ncbi:hypothetical protein [Microvirga sp. KLBC 81]|uniref:hypothetical protein n=1 Tax=Microvirga sp. KLBC 81 TaxID=1862707 RepID=UPI0010579D69|nr:hypothetical protein [Microvirga sp. KLBC 81]
MAVLSHPEGFLGQVLDHTAGLVARALSVLRHFAYSENTGDYVDDKEVRELLEQEGLIDPKPERSPSILLLWASST